MLHDYVGGICRLLFGIKYYLQSEASLSAEFLEELYELSARFFEEFVQSEAEFCEMFRAEFLELFL